MAFGADLGPQAWAFPLGVADKVPPPAPETFVPVARPARPRAKPEARQGLWTSHLHEQFGSAWIQWCLAEEWGCAQADPRFRIWRLEPEPAARVFVINSYEQLEVLVRDYPHRDDSPVLQSYGLEAEYPDWAAVRADWDAVHLTQEGQWRTRLTAPLGLYTWDCESTLWLRWAFTRVDDLGVRRVEIEEFDPA